MQLGEIEFQKTKIEILFERRFKSRINKILREIESNLPIFFFWVKFPS